MAEPKHIISWSGGKDSTATVILAHEHGIPIDEIVMACLWFDKARGISAITPEHWQFITEVAKPTFEEWGYKVTFVDAKNDYMYWFHYVIKQSHTPERNGKKRGFLLQGKCVMTTEKQQCTKRIQKSYKDCVNYVGIAIDEPERLERMHERENSISLLEQYGYTEQQAKELCKKYGLLSPLYAMGGGTLTRDGCWFCPNAPIAYFAYIREQYPNLWGEIEKLSKVENLVSSNFKYRLTFEELNDKIDKYIHRPIQCGFWELLDSTQGA